MMMAMTKSMRRTTMMATTKPMMMATIESMS
jgi:hypothetical protein